MANAWYCSREDVSNALDVKSTARSDDQIDRLIEAASRDVEGYLHGYFAPILETRYFDWPDRQMGTSYRLWLDDNYLIRIDSLTAGGVLVPATIGGLPAYFPGPVNNPSKGRPYRQLEINLAAGGAFNVGSTHQRDIAITGLWGYSDAAVTIGNQVGSLNATDDIINTEWKGVGVGTVLRIDDERMICTDRNFTDTTRNLAADLDKLASADSVLTDGSTIYSGEEIMVDSERMLVLSVTGSTLQVKRAWNGSVLATHSNGAGVYSARAFTVERGALGTTATTHVDGAQWTSWVVPGPVRRLTIAEVINSFEQEQAGYARVVGSGEGTRNASGAGLDDARMSAMTACGRQARQRAI